MRRFSCTKAGPNGASEVSTPLREAGNSKEASDASLRQESKQVELTISSLLSAITPDLSFIPGGCNFMMVMFVQSIPFKYFRNNCLQSVHRHRRKLLLIELLIISSLHLDAININTSLLGSGLPCLIPVWGVLHLTIQQ